MKTAEEIVDIAFKATDLPKDTTVGRALAEDMLDSIGLESEEPETDRERICRAYDGLCGLQKSITRMINALNRAMRANGTLPDYETWIAQQYAIRMPDAQFADCEHVMRGADQDCIETNNPTPCASCAVWKQLTEEYTDLERQMGEVR